MKQFFCNSTKRFPICLSLLFIFLIQEPSAFAKRSAEDLYRTAKKNDTELEQSPEKEKFRSQWERVIHGFLMVADRYPKSGLADDALYQAGMVTLKLRQISRSSRDTESSLQIFERLSKTYPDSRYADDAQYMIGEIYRTIKNAPEKAYTAYAEIPERFPKGDMVKGAKDRLSELPSPAPEKAEESDPSNGSEPLDSSDKLDEPSASDMKIPEQPGINETPAATEEAETQKKEGLQEAHGTTERPETPETPETKGNDPNQNNGNPVNGQVHVLGIRHWAGSDYVRVVIDLDGPVRFKQQQISNPDRVFVDIENTRLSRALKKEPIHVSKGYLKAIRMGQFNADTSRVVLDLEKIRNVSVFYLSDPDRIVMDVAGDESTTERLTRIRSKLKQGSGTLTLSEQLGMKVAKVVLDPGHGGKDPGCIGKSGLMEKEITLDVARRLKKLLKENLNLQVIMTRDRDVFVPLDERTAIANREKADLFISIHVNAAEDPSLSGVETWFLDFAASERAKKIVARENFYFQKPRSDLDKILNDLLFNSRTQESSRLAGILQNDLTSGLNQKFKDIQNHGVKGAPFVVLVGARMPSVLSEISFMSNPTEERRLKSAKYRHDIAKSLFNGIFRYVNSSEYASSAKSPKNQSE